MPEKLFATIVALLAATIFGILIKVLTFSNTYKTGSANAQLWIQSNGKNKYSKTIYEIEERQKPRHLIKSFYVYSDSAQQWFIQGILFTIVQVVTTCAVYFTKDIVIKEIENGEQIFMLMQFTTLSVFAAWLYFCFIKLLKENNRMRELSIHTNEKLE